MIRPDARRLCLYLNDDDRFGGKPLYQAVVEQARALGLAGASVFRAEIGYGAHRVVHDTQSEYSFVGAPVVVEVVDRPERIDALLWALRPMIGQRIATVTPVQVVKGDHPGAG